LDEQPAPPAPAGPTVTAERPPWSAPDPETRASGPTPPPPADPASHTAPRPGLGWRQYLAVAAVAGITSAAVAVPLASSGADPAPRGQETAADPDTTTSAAPTQDLPSDTSLVPAIAARVSPSVVRLDVAGASGRGSGSGVVLTEDGYILTNHHVVRQAQQVGVTTADGQDYTAEVVGGDPTSDIAVVKVDASGLPVPSFADEEPVPGDLAIAIGSPFGLDGSVTSGIVSALNRTVPGPDVTLIDMIQTDAAINPGNSGGALVNGRGQIIGINTAIFSAAGDSAGIGFATPVSTARTVAEQLIETGEVRSAFLGIQGQTVDPQIAELYDLPAASGAVVAEVVPDTPAAEAGLQRGDIITGIDGREITSMNELAALIRRQQPDDSVTLTVLRGGEELTIDVTLRERPQQGQ
jgi:S1-C subfamily serine protease